MVSTSGEADGLEMLLRSLPPFARRGAERRQGGLHVLDGTQRPDQVELLEDEAHRPQS
jgi:hypothetical protein